MLPFKNRLKKQKDFNLVFRQGKGYREKEIFIKILEKEDSGLRFGFVVSRKVSNRAVTRNRLKRKLREAIRSILLHIKQGYDVVVIALPGAEKYDFWELQEIILTIFQKAGIIKQNE
ncbi:ribonuclease P protein component [bacterium]|nr:ribonuclease P protein component [bacterium]